MTLPDGMNVFDKPAPFTYEADFAGTTAYGEANGHAKVAGETIIDGRTVRLKARLLVRFDAPVCPGSFAGELKTAIAKFAEVESGYVGLTTKPVPYITETSPDYNAGIKAMDQKHYSLAMMLLKPFADKGQPAAQSELGYMYEDGLGVAIDLSEAVRWYRLAAEQGDPYSQTRLAICTDGAWEYRATTRLPQNGTARRRRQETSRASPRLVRCIATAVALAGTTRKPRSGFRWRPNRGPPGL